MRGEYYLMTLVWLHHHLTMSAVSPIDPMASMTVTSMPMTDMTQPPLT